VRINGVEQQLPAGAVQSETNELFVAADVINGWFPVQFRVEMAELALYAASTEELPMAARLARQRLWASRARGPALAGAPRHPLTSPQFSWPDLRLNYGLSGGNRLGELAQSYGVQARGALLGMDSFLNLGFADGGYGEQGLTSANFRMVQRAPSNTLGAEWLGSLAGRSLELGDVALPFLPLLANRTTGAGATFTNAPENFVSGLKDFALQGDAPVGWDVEVYRNGSLSTFGTVGADGRYRFDNLTLSSGMNDFRIVLYGPQGQRDERFQSFRVGPGLVGSGELVYQVGALASSAPLIRAAGSLQPQGGSTVVLNTTYGLTDKLALTAGVASGPLGGANRQNAGANVGFRASMGNSFHQADYALLADGTTGYSARSTWRVLDDIDLGAFITRQASGTLNVTQAERIYGVDFADTVHLGGMPLRYGLAYSETRYGNQPRTERLLATQNWQLGKVNFNNSMGLRRTKDELTPEAGNLEFATRVAGLPLRGNVGYQLEGDDVITAVGLGTQVRLGDDNSVLSLAANVRPAAGQGGVAAGLQRSVGPLTVALNSSYNSNQTFQAGVNLGLALASAGDAPRWKLADARTEGFGYATADVLLFVDENNNGVRDAGEPPVPEAKLANLRTANTQTTNAQGVARFGDLLPNTEVGIQIDEESLPDLYLRPRNVTHVLQTRTGYGGVVQLPLQRLGELGGQVLGVAAANYRNVSLWLTDAKGQELQRTGTDEGGNFNFQPLVLGRYTLHAQLKGGVAVAVPVSLSKANQVLDNVTVRLPTP
ncbi:MAG: hypothetical protein INF43_02050, partial [Alphaproteobacteria bacterium]|nr:hypothetical protein [Alphaproteobacteria bacterium]